MVEFLWLNFTLWARIPCKFQLKIYTDMLLQARNQDIHTGFHSFNVELLEFLLDQTQLPFTETVPQDLTLLFFPEEGVAIEKFGKHSGGIVRRRAARHKGDTVALFRDFSGDDC
jgi:hypothetical protein